MTFILRLFKLGLDLRVALAIGFCFIPAVQAHTNRCHELLASIAVHSFDDYVRHVKSTGNFLSDPFFYAFFSNHPEWTRQLINRWYRFYPDELGKEVLSTAHDVKPQHLPLLLDPGIVVRLEDFLKFYREHSGFPDSTAFEIREMYGRTLGESIVWRGMILQNDELQKIHSQGIRGRIFDTRQYVDKVYKLFDGNDNGMGGLTGPNGFVDALSTHISGFTQWSPLVSVSKWIEVTHAGAWDDSHHNWPRRQGRFYLFKIRIPNIDLIKLENRLARPRERWLERNPLYITGRADGQGEFREYFSNPEFEMFTNYIHPSWIIETIPYDNLPPRWRRENTR